jgi:hypothetical protein
MIVYDVKCTNGHVFTAWFRNSDSFDQQVAAGEVACAECGVLEVGRAPMAPRLISSRGRARRAEPVAAAEQPESASPAEAPATPAPPQQISAVHAQAAIMQQLRALRHAVEQNCDYVGKEFAEEARKMHYGESDRHGIYGEATESESEALADEGIEIGRVPWIPQSDH